MISAYSSRGRDQFTNTLLIYRIRRDHRLDPRGFSHGTRYPQRIRHPAWRKRDRLNFCSRHCIGPRKNRLPRGLINEFMQTASSFPRLLFPRDRSAFSKDPRLPSPRAARLNKKQILHKCFPSVAVFFFPAARWKRDKGEKWNDDELSVAFIPRFLPGCSRCKNMYRLVRVFLLNTKISRRLHAVTINGKILTCFHGPRLLLHPRQNKRCTYL